MNQELTLLLSRCFCSFCGRRLLREKNLPLGWTVIEGRLICQECFNARREAFLFGTRTGKSNQDLATSEKYQALLESL